MAIIGPADLPVVLKVPSDSMKHYCLSQLGHGIVDVEITEPQMEAALRVTGDFIAGYFPREQRLASFYTSPLVSTYPLPSDAYWVQEVSWTPLATTSLDIFGVEAFLVNAGNIAGITGAQGLLTDYHLLQSYRKFAQKILGTEGHWEVIGEGPGGPETQKIRLYPTPKGAYPVLVLYQPVVTHFRSPQAKLIAHEMLLAEVKMMVGAARRKISGFPTPDGGSVAMDGEALVMEGKAEKEALITKAIQLGEPLGVYTW